ncbi:MAG: aminomethyl transferase family protein [Chloroflexi bacterium]|nr:aminomethyl transferase family protein [Chloroflexota bacterium]
MSASQPPIKLTPLFTQAQNLKAQFVVQDGWQLPRSYGAGQTELVAARQGVWRHGVALADDSPNGKIMLEGREAQAVLQQVFGLETLAPDIGLGAVVAPGYIFRLRRDQFFISTSPGAEAGIVARLAQAGRSSGQLVAAHDITHGRAEIRVIGPASRAFLSKLCGLDFHPTIFPNLAVRQSSLAKTTQIIIRRDLGVLPAFSVIGARSLAAYLWRIMLQAGAEWDIAPLGQAALEELGALLKKSR